MPSKNAIPKLAILVALISAAPVLAAGTTSGTAGGRTSSSSSTSGGQGGGGGAALAEGLGAHAAAVSTRAATGLMPGHVAATRIASAQAATTKAQLPGNHKPKPVIPQPVFSARENRIYRTQWYLYPDAYTCIRSSLPWTECDRPTKAGPHS
jgi:hypothetical protein